MKTHLLKTTIYLVSILLISSCKPEYGTIMSKAVKRAIGKDVRKYKTFSYPTNNYGLYTSFKETAIPENQICAMFSCLNKPLPDDSQQWLKMDGLADIGEGGNITLSENTKTKVAVNAILPKMWEVVGISGGFNSDKTTKITLDLGPGYVRYANKLKLSQHINNLPDTDQYKVMFANKQLVVVVSDVIVNSLTATVSVDNTTASQIDAKFDAGQLSKEFGNIDLKVSVNKNVNGDYTFKVNHPVILLRLEKKQPASGGLGATTTSSPNDFSDWIDMPGDKVETSSPIGTSSIR